MDALHIWREWRADIRRPEVRWPAYVIGFVTIWLVVPMLDLLIWVRRRIACAQADTSGEGGE